MKSFLFVLIALAFAISAFADEPIADTPPSGDDKIFKALGVTLGTIVQSLKAVESKQTTLLNNDQAWANKLNEAVETINAKLAASPTSRSMADIKASLQSISESIKQVLENPSHEGASCMSSTQFAALQSELAAIRQKQTENSDWVQSELAQLKDKHAQQLAKLAAEMRDARMAMVDAAKQAGSAQPQDDSSERDVLAKLQSIQEAQNEIVARLRVQDHSGFMLFVRNASQYLTSLCDSVHASIPHYKEQASIWTAYCMQKLEVVIAFVQQYSTLVYSKIEESTPAMKKAYQSVCDWFHTVLYPAVGDLYTKLQPHITQTMEMTNTKLLAMGVPAGHLPKVWLGLHALLFLVPFAIMFSMCWCCCSCCRRGKQPVEEGSPTREGGHNAGNQPQARAAQRQNRTGGDSKKMSK